MADNTITFTDIADVPHSSNQGGSEDNPRVYKPPKRQPTSSRLSVPLTEKGTLDFDAMREDTKTRLLDACRTPAIKAELFPEMGAVTFEDSDVAALLGIWTTAESILGRIAFKIPADIAKEHFHYTTEQFDRIKEPTKKVMARYMPAIYTTNKELATFLFEFSLITREQFQGAIVATIQRRQAVQAVQAAQQQQQEQIVNGMAVEQ